MQLLFFSARAPMDKLDNCANQSNLRPQEEAYFNVAIIQFINTDGLVIYV